MWKNEKDSTLEVPVNLQNDRVYGKEKKSDILVENLPSSTNRMSKKIMVSTAISWYFGTKLFVVNDNRIQCVSNYLFPTNQNFRQIKCKIK